MRKLGCKGLVASLSFLFSIMAFSSGTVMANPTGGEVAAGSATISQSPGYTQINQSTDKAVINWQGFSIGASEHTHFQQPSASSITLNRVTAANNPSLIFGKLTANGQIMLLNPAGIVFGKNSQVDVAALIATTANIKDADFMAGHYQFTQDPHFSSAIINEGTIKVADRGLVALVAPGVENRGIIQANVGKVALASGNEFIVDLQGDQLIQFTDHAQVIKQPTAPDGRKLSNAVSNSGSIIADGGTVLLTAEAAEAIVDNVVNMDGVIQARSISGKNGQVILSGGKQGVVRVAGNIDVSGKNTGEKGGVVKITGNKVGLFAGTKINASGKAGGGTVLVGGDYQGKGNTPHAQAAYVDKDAVIEANATEKGDGGKVVVWSDGATRFYGSIYAMGGPLGGNGGLVETSGHWIDVMKGTVSTSASAGSVGNWLLDPGDITICASGIGCSPSGGSIQFTSGTSAAFIWNSGTATSVIDASDITNSLFSGFTDVTISTAGGVGGTGNITINDGVDLNAAGSVTSLTLIADNNLLVGQGGALINLSVTGGLNLIANNEIVVNNALTSSTGPTNFQANILSLNNLINGGSNVGLSGTNIGTVNVAPSASINQGLALVQNNGDLNVAAGTYNEAVSISNPVNIATTGGTVNINSLLDTAGTLGLAGNWTTTAVAGNFTALIPTITLNGNTTLTSNSGNVSLGNTSGTSNINLSATNNTVQANQLSTTGDINIDTPFLATGNLTGNNIILNDSNTNVIRLFDDGSGTVTLTATNETTINAPLIISDPNVDLIINGAELTLTNPIYNNAMPILADATQLFGPVTTVNVEPLAVINQGLIFVANNGTLNVTTGSTHNAENVSITRPLNLTTTGSGAVSVNTFGSSASSLGLQGGWTALTGNLNINSPTTLTGSTALTANNGVLNLMRTVSGPFSLTLIGNQGVFGNVNVSQLIVGGSNGGNLTGIVNGISGTLAAFVSQLAGGAAGQFFMNNCLIPTICSSININPRILFPDTFTQNAGETDHEKILVCTFEANSNPKINKPTCVEIEKTKELAAKL